VRFTVRIAVLLLAIFSIPLAAPLPGIAHADAQSPSSTIAVGDWWTYNLQDPGVGISGTITQTLTGSLVLLVKGVSTPCYTETISGTGTFARPGLSGTFTETGTGYVRQSDLGAINSNVTVVITAGLTLTQNTYSNNSIPVVNEQFPLYTGKTWVETYTTTNRVTTFTSLNPTPTITTSNNYTAQLYSVTGSSVISVNAGSYLAYDIHSTNSTGTQDAYYSPQVENMVKGVSYYPNGTVQSTITLQDFNAWAYQSSVTVAKGGSKYDVGLMADATISNQSSNNTAITFQVNATSGTSGRANVAIPLTLNNTVVKVYVDSNLETVNSSKNSTDYQLFFTFGLTTHTVTVLYTATLGTPWTTYLIYGGIAAAALALIVAAFLILRRRTKPPAVPTAPAEPYPPPTATPLPSPSP